MIRCLCVFAGVLQLMSVFAFAVSAKYFTDTYYGYVFLDDINYVADNGIMNGTSSTTFGLDGEISRAMIIAILYNKEGRPTTTASNPFSDVSSTAYYYNAVRWAYSKGIVSGAQGGSFLPDNSVTREEVAVFFYRYAKYKGYDTASTVSITGLSDYSSISTYARGPVAWALSKRIVLGGCSGSFNDASGPSGTFGPKAYTTRAQFARIVVRFGKNAEGILMNKDAYSFENKAKNFGYSINSGNYYMTTRDWSALKQTVASVYGTGSTCYQQMLNRKDEAWSGSCFGMALSTILDKIGKIDLNGNCSSSSTMYGLSTPANNNKLESAINYHHMLQYIPSISKTKQTPSAANVTILINALKKNGLVLFSYLATVDNSQFGHAIVAYNCIQNSDGSYSIEAYDSRTANRSITLTIPAAKNKITLHLPDGTAEVVDQFYFIDDFLPYDIYDIDGVYNDSPYTTATAAVSNNLLSEYVQLSVSAGSSFTIVNAEGQTLTGQNGNFSGTMETAGATFMTNGADQPVEWVLYVRPSESFVCTAEEINRFSLMSEDHYTSVCGSGIGAAQIQNDTTICLTGEDMNYEAVLFLGGPQQRQVKMKGTQETAISFEQYGNGVCAQSQTGQFDLSVHKDLQILDQRTFTEQPHKIYAELTPSELAERESEADQMLIYGEEALSTLQKTINEGE